MKLADIPRHGARRLHRHQGTLGAGNRAGEARTTQDRWTVLQAGPSRTGCIPATINRPFGSTCN